MRACTQARANALLVLLLTQHTYDNDTRMYVSTGQNSMKGWKSRKIVKPRNLRSKQHCIKVDTYVEP